jgi:hypothetical protein
MSLLANEAHEAFAQSRFAGHTLVEAHQTAGLGGDKVAASRLARLPEVRERIAELYRERAAETAYDKSSAVRDLLTIIHTSPADAEEAGAEHPLCEVRMGKDGPYHRFPPKLQAMARLIRLMDWDNVTGSGPNEADEAEKRDTLTDWLAAIRSGRLRNAAASDPEPQRHEGLSDGPTDVETAIATMKRRIYGDDPAKQGNAIRGMDTTSVNSGGEALTPKQEAFANARVKGLGVMAAYHAAGYEGDTPNLAWRLNSLPKVKARIAELNGTVEAVTGYGKDDAVRDLVAIVHARPQDATPDHPLCEVRMTSWGKYHRFPSKLSALILLARVCSWTRKNQAKAEPHDPDARLRSWLLRLRKTAEIRRCTDLGSAA